MVIKFKSPKIFWISSAVFVVLCALVVLVFPDDQLWIRCREINGYLAGFAAMGIMWRMVPMVLDPARRRYLPSIHFMAWFLVIFLSLIVTSIAYFNVPAGYPAQWTAGARFMLTIATVMLCLWWPHPRRLQLARGEDNV